MFYSQLYVISSISKEGHSSPSIFAFLPNKSTATYLTLWRSIKEFLGPEYSPNSMLCDMETAAIKAFIEVYPGVQIILCYFHWRKALRDNLAKKKAAVEVNKNRVLNKLYRMICALAFVPPSHTALVADAVIIPYLNRHQDEDLSEEAVAWADYFLDTYVGMVR